MNLYTNEGKNIEQLPWNIYPRPSLRREAWLCLNGKWKFILNGIDKGEILVPFCPESILSGIDESYPKHMQMQYSRDFMLEEDYIKGRVILHFGAVDQTAQVLINGKIVGNHEGGYLPFSFDITDYVHEGSNTICVIAEDNLDAKYPHGKQSAKRGGMWYTPVSGIWQSVWLEPVANEYIKSLDIQTSANRVHIKVDGAKEGNLLLEGKSYAFSNGQIDIELENPIYWSPENPKLYEFSISTANDKVYSYFTIRTIEVRKINGKQRICLNGKPIFCNAVLDQGYFSDGIYTPASPILFEKDISTMKSLGFNTIRKHIKIEPEQFYYDCDRLGILVFQDMVNNGEYSFMRDTILPTLGIKCINDKNLNNYQEYRLYFLKHMLDTVRHLKKFNCIVLWTIFNEGWGQFNADTAYDMLKEADATRLIDATSGWFAQSKSDVISNHIYFKKLKMEQGTRPYIISEYGGYVWKIDEHSYNTNKTYGYKILKSKQDYIDAIKKLFTELVGLAEQGLCAAVYTQLSDVEDETNGILSYDRAICRLNSKMMQDFAEELQKAVEK